MAAVDVRVGHADDLVVPELGLVEVLVHAGAKGGDHGLDLGVGEDLVEPRLFDVENLAAQGQDRLKITVPAELGAAAGGIAFDDEQLAQRRVLLLAVGELAGQSGRVKGRLAARELPGFASRVARARGGDALVDDQARLRGVFLEEARKALGDGVVDERADVRVAELGLGLAFELRLDELDGHDRGQPLADILAGERLVRALEQAAFLGVVVDHARHGGLEADEVRAALDGGDIVREREYVLVVAVVVLHRDLDGRGLRAVLKAVGREINRLGMQRLFIFIEMLDERHDAALVAERLGAHGIGALVGRRDADARVEEG